MYRRAFLQVVPLLVAGIVFVAPLGAYAQVTPTTSAPTTASTKSTSFFGPIIPTSCNCDTTVSGNGATTPTSAADWGCVFQTIQNLMKLAVSFGILVVVLAIAYAGFLFILAPTNEENRSKAKQALWNALIGLALVLAAWLIVDTLMKVIYNSAAQGSGVALGPWNSILSNSSASNCILPQKAPTAFQTVMNLANPANPGGGSGNPNAPLSTAGVGACNASTIQSDANAGGGQMSNQEADILACVAGPESSCGSINQNYNWDAAKSPPPSTAWGPFQITLKGNSDCFNNSTCEAAAGVSGPLNCKNAFTSAGYSIPGTLLQECQTAAANLNCSAVAADCVYHKPGGASAWTADPNSTKQQACISGGGG